MKKAIILILSIIVSGLLILNTLESSIRGAYFSEYNAAARTLRYERNAVSDELDEINRQLNNVVIGKGCISFVFTELYDELYTDIAPIMAHNGWVGTMAISAEQFPGAEGCITVAQCKRLLASGWNLCVDWDDYLDLRAYTEQLHTLCEEAGLEMPTLLYAETGSYHSFKDSEIEGCGYTTVIHHGESGAEPVAREDHADLFHIGSIAWNAPGVKSVVEQCAEYGGSLTLYTDFSTEHGIFRADLFENMCAYLNTQNDRIYVANLTGARENLSMVETNAYLEARKEYLEQEIQRYDDEIAAVYKLNFFERKLLWWK